MTLTDEELLRKTAAARAAAHNAPKRIQGEHIHGTACFDRARDWMILADEVERRGLPQPEASDVS